MEELKVDEVYKTIDELREYSKLEGTEISELCEALESVYGFGGYYLTEGFEMAVVSEIQAQLENFKQFTKIIKREETFTRTVVDLEWD